MIFADQRFNRADKRGKLPAWIIQYLDKSHLNLSTDRALTVAKDFLKRMAQPRSHKEELGTTMLDEATVHRMLAAQAQAKDEEMKQAEHKEESSHTVTVAHAAPVPWTVTAMQSGAFKISATSTSAQAPASSADSNQPAPMEIE